MGSISELENQMSLIFMPEGIGTDIIENTQEKSIFHYGRSKDYDELILY